MQFPPSLAIFVHPSAEHIFLYCFLATFLGTCSPSFAVGFRFLVVAFVSCEAFADDLLRAAAELARVEVARRRVEETSADDFVFSVLFAAAAAAASFFLS
jgi:hypothetical protein